MRVAFVNMVAYGYYSGRRRFAEPAHLLPMHNIMRAAGHQSMVFQFGHPSDRISIRDIRRYAPDFLGLSYVGHREEAIVAGKELLESFSSRKRPSLVIGGTDVDYYFGQYLETFQPLYPQKNGNFVVVSGPGENVIRAMAEGSFSFNGQQPVSGRSKMSLAGLDFARPYSDLAVFDRAAQVIWERNCTGKCFFCPNEAKSPEYRTPEQARVEAVELKRMGAKNIAIASPNFLASPRKGSAIIAAVSEDAIYEFPSRVDSLYLALRKYPKVWERFRTKDNHIHLGIERFLPEGLMRIGKYGRLSLANKQAERLEYIFKFFKGSSTAITVFMIPFDWGMNLGELEQEVRLLAGHLTNYTPNIMIAPEHLGQILVYNQGSKFAKQGMQPADFYRFERDPRCLMLAMLTRTKIEQIYEHNVEGVNDSVEMYNYVAIRILRAMMASIRAMKSVSADRFDIDAIVEMMQGEWTPQQVLNKFYSQLPSFERESLKRDFTEAFLRQFPELAPPKKQGFLKKLFA